MTYLEGVQLFHKEAKLAGPVPSTVVGQSGRALDLVRWYAQAWQDIQMEADGRWKWLRTPYSFPTSINVNAYAQTVTGIGTRLGAWHLNDDEPPLIYKISDGQVAQGRLLIEGSWPRFRNNYLIGTPAAGPPQYCALGPDDKLYLGPTPDGAYQISGDIWKGPQVLAVNEDEPEMPRRFHPLIAYRGLIKYGYNTVSNDTLMRVKTEYAPLWDALLNSQGHARFNIQIGPALA